MRGLATKLARYALIAITLATLAAEFVAPYGYATQSREEISVAPSHAHPLGTDKLGRDRLSRLLYGARLSLLLAPAAALVALAFALSAALTAAFSRGVWRRVVTLIIDLVLSLPWLFLLFTVRALLPLNTAPLASAAVVFALLGTLGWAAPARVLLAAAEQELAREHTLMARASGLSTWRLLWIHVAPNLAPVLRAQFWTLAPAFLLGEANLSMLGLGIAEPLPSWGSLLRELQDLSSLPREPWLLVPLVLLILTLVCCQFGFRRTVVAGTPVTEN